MTNGEIKNERDEIKKWKYKNKGKNLEYEKHTYTIYLMYIYNVYI